MITEHHELMPHFSRYGRVALVAVMFLMSTLFGSSPAIAQSALPMVCGKINSPNTPVLGPATDKPTVANEGGLPSSVVVDGLDGHPTDLAIGPDGTIYVAVTYSPTYPLAFYSMFYGRVYAVVDGKASLLLDGLHYPTGLTFLGSDLYIATLSDIVRVQDVKGTTCSSVDSVVTNLPFDESHWTNGVTAHDGRIYAITGHVYKAASTSQLDLMGSLWSFLPDGSDVRVEATGLRNSYAVAFGPDGTAWASDNGPNYLYDPDITSRAGEYDDELNAIVPGNDYGFHPSPMSGWFDSQPSSDIAMSTPSASPQASPVVATVPCVDSLTCGTPPALSLGAHTAPTGVIWSDERQQVFAAKSSWGQVVWYDPATNTTDVLLWNLNIPTGIELDSSGDIYVCEWFANRVIRVDLPDPS